jgi:hypothetical protein
MLSKKTGRRHLSESFTPFSINHTSGFMPEEEPMREGGRQKEREGERDLHP